jgi:hypothetical protein
MVLLGLIQGTMSETDSLMGLALSLKENLQREKREFSFSLTLKSIKEQLTSVLT